MADAAAPPLPTIVALGVRDRARDALKRAFPRRRGRLTLVRSASELRSALRAQLADAVIVDLGGSAEAPWAAAALARDFPSLPFFALMPARASELPAIARVCGELEFADLLVEGVDDAVPRELLVPVSYSVRFADALGAADARLGLSTPLQAQVWRLVLAHGGRTVRTEELAAAVGLTREHLSRRFAADGAPNLKRIIDLVRLLSASELAKNPGYDLPDVARVLGYASASHLGSSCQRVLGVRPSSLARLRPGDLLDRFVKAGRGRSRGVTPRS